jgi:hypothetical protein
MLYPIYGKYGFVCQGKMNWLSLKARISPVDFKDSPLGDGVNPPWSDKQNNPGSNSHRG